MPPRNSSSSSRRTLCHFFTASRPLLLLYSYYCNNVPGTYAVPLSITQHRIGTTYQATFSTQRFQQPPQKHFGRKFSDLWGVTMEKRGPSFDFRPELFMLRTSSNDLRVHDVLFSFFGFLSFENGSYNYFCYLKQQDKLYIP